jgi:hypothetical protein
MIGRKKKEGIALYPEDWIRITNNLGSRESKIAFIEAAILKECESRERIRQAPVSLISLT